MTGKAPTIVVDRELCMGSGMCIVYAPGTFAHDDETKAIVVDPAGDPIEAIRNAVQACPTGAITLEENYEKEHSMQLEGKSIVAMGAGSGVGRATALRFTEEGAKVVVADVDLERAKGTVQLIEEAGGTAIADQCDVSKESDVEATIALAVSSFGRLDIIFNNVGVPTPRPGLIFEDHTSDDFDRLFAINAKGVFNGSKFAIKQFKQQGDGGVILNTGSVAGLVSWGGSVYGSTKGAVHQLTKAAAIEGAPFGIRCNAICPAGMPFTNFTNAMGMTVSEADKIEMAKGVGSMHPLGQPITAEDCAEAAVYLVSDGAKNITGVLLPVDGGYVTR